MNRLIPLSELARDRNWNFRHEGIYDPTDEPAYGGGKQRIGKIRGALVDEVTGRIQYLIVDVGGWMIKKEALVPVGLARIEEDAVYFDTLSREQVRMLSDYRPGSEYDQRARMEDEKVLRAGPLVPPVEPTTTVGNEDVMPAATTGREPAETDHLHDGADDLAEEGTMSIGYNKGSSAAMSGETAAGGVTGTADNVDSERRYTSKPGVRNEPARTAHVVEEHDEMYRLPERMRPLQERLVIEPDVDATRDRRGR